MRANPLCALVAAGAIVLAACATPASTSTSAPPAATRPPVTAAPATATQPPGSATTVAAAQPSSTTAAQPSAAAKPAAAAGLTRTFAIQPDQSQVTLKVKEQFADAAATSDAVFTSKEIKGQLVVTREGVVVPDGSRFTVGLDTLKSDRGQRDQYIKRTALETSRFPTAELVPTELKLAVSVPTAGPIKGQLVGNMTIHGTTRPITFEIDATLDATTVKGTAQSSFKITDFGMQLPRVPVILSIEDLARLQIDFTANSGA